KDYVKQLEIFKQQYGENVSYKDKYVSKSDYAIVYEGSKYSGIPGTCVYKYYEFYKSEKSLDDVRKKMDYVYQSSKGTYQNPPKELSVFEPKTIILKPTLSD